VTATDALGIDEERLRQLNRLIDEGERFERQEAARRAEEERRRQEAEAARPGLTLDDLKRRRDELQVAIIERQTRLSARRPVE